MIEKYTPSELKVLWYLKKNGTMSRPVDGSSRSLMKELSLGTQIPVSSLRHFLSALESRSLLLRTYKHKKATTFKTQGHNPILKIELVDPEMVLPPIPHASLGVVIAQQNEELLERVAHEPSAEDIVDALLNRVTELQTQVNKLQGVIEAQESEVCKLRKQAAESNHKPKVHISQRLQDALTKEQWEELRHK
jgi:hypothetical protein